MLANQARFKSSKEIGVGLYEMQFGHKKIGIDLPIQVNEGYVKIVKYEWQCMHHEYYANLCAALLQIGINILFEAKRIMCTFAFDFVDYFIHR